MYELDPLTLRSVGARNAINFSGTFLTDEAVSATDVPTSSADIKPASKDEALDEALRARGAEYNLTETAETMDLREILSPDSLVREARKLGLDPSSLPHMEKSLESRNNGIRPRIGFEFNGLGRVDSSST